MATGKIDICVVDDHQIFRKAMIRLLKTFERVGKVVDAENGKQCLQVVADQHPQVVLLDLEMPVMNGIECAEALLKKFPDTKIVILTMHDSGKYMSYMMELGVHSFLLKNTDPEELEKAIYSVVDKDFYHNDLLASVLRKSLKSRLKNERPEFNTVQQPLSDRELEILRLICEERSLREIAVHLAVSEKTIQSHKLNIQTKLSVRSTVGLIKAAYEMGLIS